MVNIQLSGAEMVLKAFEDHGVDTIFGYPGGAVLPIYDELAKRSASKDVIYDLNKVYGRKLKTDISKNSPINNNAI